MNRITATVMLVLLTAMIFTAGIAPVLAAGESGKTGNTEVNINNGLPVVTEEEFTAKTNGVAMKIYNTAATVVPYVAVAVIAAGAIAGIFLKGIRKAILWAVGALVLVVCAPWLIGFVYNLVK